jgi:hypothetical protein
VEKMRKPSRVISRTLIVLALVIALSVSHLSPVKATSNTPVFVLGVSSPADPLATDLQSLTSSVTILNSVTGLLTLSPASILFIDGSWLTTVSSLDPTVMPIVVQTVLAGLPTIVVRGDPSILANSITGLLKYENPGLPLISEGLQINGTLTNGTRPSSVLRVLAGFDYAVAAEFQWANQEIPQATQQIGLPLSLTRHHLTTTADTLDPQAPYWRFNSIITTDTGDLFQPYGRVITTTTSYNLTNSGSTSFSWYNIYSNQTFMPGAEIYSNNYRNYLESASSSPTDQTTNLYIDNGPASLSTSGPSTVTFSIGTQAGVSDAVVTSTQTMSYFLKNSNLDNTSSSPSVSWTQTINGGTAVGKITLQTIQGWTDKVVQCAPLSIEGNTSVTFATFSGGQPTSTALTGIAFGIGSSHC